MSNRNFDNITSFPTFLNQIANDTVELIAIDTAGYSDNGINFHTSVAFPGYSDGEYKFELIHSDTLDSGYEVVPKEAIIGNISDYPYLKNLEITGSSTEGKGIPFVQLKYSKRYVAFRITSSGIVGDGCGLFMLMNLSRGEEPVDRAGEQLNYHSFI